MTEEFDDDEPSTAGWDAISKQLDSVYGVQEPMHYGTVLPFSLGGKDPLQGISVYRNRDEDGDWFHYVTYGFSELYDKESEDPEWSGFGFEMTFRLATYDIDKEPPTWPLNVLQNLARYVFQSGNIFQPGHSLPFNGPIMIGSPTKIRGGFFVIDDLLGSIETPNGRVEFLQLVGCTEDEILELKRWNAAGFEATMRQINPRLLTDLDRDSIADDPKLAQQILDGARAEGSETDVIYTQEIRLETSADGVRKLHLPAIVVADLAAILPGRLRFDRPFFLQTKEALIGVFPTSLSPPEEADQCSATIQLSPDEVDKIADSVRPTRGEYPISPTLTIEVHPKEIFDQEGNVIQVIG
ncbi:suppressor of fused domain protein [Blastopirellula marina]|nr:suppressor of fused domain protein [Blastopirellula marina]